MARYRNIVQSGKAPEALRSEIEAYLVREGFKLQEGSDVWKKGIGIMVGPQFVRFAVTSAGLELEAWIKWALLPGVYVGEFDIHGFVGAIPKKLLRDRIKAIEAMA